MNERDLAESKVEETQLIVAFAASRFDDGAIESKDHRAILEEVKEETKDELNWQLKGAANRPQTILQENHREVV